jgi:hypothetical protein
VFVVKGEKTLLKRVLVLPCDFGQVYLADLKATAEERLAFFEKIAKK